MSWLDKFFTGGIKNVAIAGTLLPQEVTLNFVSGASGVDNPGLSRSDVTISVLSPPTGTGFVHVIGGSVDAAARAVNLSGSDVTSTLGVANGGTGLSAAGSNGQILTIVSGAPAWAANAASTTWANDLAGNGTTTNTNQYVSSLSFSSAAAGGTIAVNGTNTTLQWASGGTNAGLSQASTSGATGSNITIQSQASTASPGTPGNVIINTPDKVGAGTVGYAKIQGASSTKVTFGAWNNTNTAGGDGVIFLGNAGDSPDTTHYAMEGGSGHTQLNAGTDLWLGIANVAYQYITANAVTFFNGFTEIRGGGTGVLGIANAGTAPTSNPAGGGILYAINENAVSQLHWRDSGGTVSQITPRGVTTTLANGTASWTSPITGWVTLTWAGGGGGGAGGAGSNTAQAPGGGGGGGAQRIIKTVQVTAGTQYDLTYGAGGGGGSAGAGGGQNRGGAGGNGGDSTFVIHGGATLAIWPGAGGAPASAIIGDSSICSLGGTDNRVDQISSNAGLAAPPYLLPGWGGNTGSVTGVQRTGTPNVDSTFNGGAQGGATTGSGAGGGAGATSNGAAGAASGTNNGSNAAASSSAGGGGGGGGNNAAGGSGGNGGSAGSLIIQY